MQTTFRSEIDTVAAFTRTAPVDVYALGRALGLRIVDEVLPENISGKIEKPWFSSAFQITVNKRHPLTRRRFTVAHEIGHYVLHRDHIGDGIVDDGLYRSDRSDEVERHANSYAASILMPAPLVGRAWRGGEKSFTGMAKIFDVSPEVARIRMRELRLG